MKHFLSILALMVCFYAHAINPIVPNFATTNTPSALTNIIQNFAGVIAQFGALGGDVDDTAAFQAAADSGADVFVPAITNGYTMSNIILKNNSHLRGGGSARLKMKSTATGKFIAVQSSAVTNIIFTGFVLDGQGVGATGSGGAPWTFTAGYAVVSSFTTDRSGLYLYNNQTNSFISDLLVKNFSNKGIWIEGALGTFPQPTSHTLSGYDLRLENCYQGILFTNSAEYCSFQDVNCFHCGEAVAIWSGNVNIRGGVMTRNGCGIRVVGSGVTNPAHGSVEDVVLNHNDVSILCTDFNNGFNFNNLIILGGGGEGGGNPIFLTNTCGVNIQNSTLNSGMFASADGGSASANGYNYIDHCKVTGHVPVFQTSSGHLIYNEAVDYSVLTAPLVTNNFSMAFNAAYFPALTANQILSLNSTNRVSNISGIDISTVLHGGTPPAFQQVALATDVSGTLADNHLSSNVGLLNRDPQTFTGVNNFQTVTSTALNVTGAVGLNGPVNFTNTVTHQGLVTNAAAVYGTMQTNTGAVKASEFVGDGSKLTGVVAATGAIASTNGFGTNATFYGTGGNPAFQAFGGMTNKFPGTNVFTAGTTNGIIVTDTNGTTTTRIFTQSGVIYSSASPPNQTISVDEWTAASGRIVATAIDGKTVGNTTLYTVPSGRQLIVERLIIIPTTVSSLVTLSTLSLGKTSSAYTDVVAATLLTGVTGTSTGLTMSPIAGATVLQAGDALVLRVSSGAVATTYTFTAVVIGVLL